jgi:hypothetical protein
MKYELEIIRELLSECGIHHKFDPLVKPEKHHRMKTLEFYLTQNDINYMYFSDTDSLAITNINPESEFAPLCHTLIMPSKDSLDVLVHISNTEYAEDVIEMIECSLSSVLPEELDYRIMGVI